MRYFTNQWPCMSILQINGHTWVSYKSMAIHECPTNHWPYINVLQINNQTLVSYKSMNIHKYPTNQWPYISVLIINNHTWMSNKSLTIHKYRINNWPYDGCPTIHGSYMSVLQIRHSLRIKNLLIGVNFSGESIILMDKTVKCILFTIDCTICWWKTNVIVYWTLMFTVFHICTYIFTRCFF